MKGGGSSEEWVELADGSGFVLRMTSQGLVLLKPVKNGASNARGGANVPPVKNVCSLEEPTETELDAFIIYNLSLSLNIKCMYYLQVLPMIGPN